MKPKGATMTVSEKVKELAVLRANATAGRWWRIDPPWGNGDTVHVGPTDDPHSARSYICTSVPWEDECTEPSNVADDMAFIAAAGSFDFAALLEEIEELEHGSEANRLMARHNESKRVELEAELDRLRKVASAAKEYMKADKATTRHVFSPHASKIEGMANRRREAYAELDAALAALDATV